MPASSQLLALADHKYVSLITFRKSGVGVSTTVWMARDGDSLVVTTVDGSGKVKRLRNDPRVQLAPASQRGKVEPDAAWVDGTATVESMSPASSAGLAAKYKLAFRITEWMARRRKADAPARVIVRIS